MDELLDGNVAALLGDAETGLLAFVEMLMRPWMLIQVAIIVAAILLSFVVGRFAEARLEPRVRAIRGQPRLLRFLALLLRRTSWIVLALVLLAVLTVMRTVTWPSRTYLLLIATSLVAAWVLISVISKLIRNRAVARIVAILAWAFVALRITGLLDEATELLDAAALQIGSFRLSLLFLIQAVLLLSGLLWLAVTFGNFVEQRLERASDLTPTIRVLLGKVVKFALIIAAAATALSAVGVDLTALTVFSGAVGVGIGFGLQKVVSNFISGMIILLDKSIKPGDTISLGETFGWIRELRARFVSVVTRDGKEFLIPNEDFITQQVVNWSFTDTLIRLDVHFGVAYTSDPHQVSRLAIEAAKSVERVHQAPPPVCWLTGFGDSSIDFILRFWIRDPQNGLTNVRGKVLLACWDAFKEAGVAIPFPHRQVILSEPVEVRVSQPPGAEGSPKDKARSTRARGGARPHADPKMPL
ncbi:Mechanosensitive ion channel [Afifella marina DSM 2698]|uniref:Mechanosensitive ion channel n=3 Tax=Hyphomicrobiales TaxID=356 RepID=A0A1G5NJT2_AFIMA|nr:mechanosensitive ion channel domain-containing protein [Afifella marina]SCZ37009.1 Mechanosensitive ion channel [Afifella marina DSM 2698]